MLTAQKVSNVPKKRSFVKKFIKNLKNQNGFSLTEVVLTLVVATMLAGVSSQTMMNNMDSYAFMATRRAAVADSRHSINQVSYELRGLTTAEITEITPTKISFKDTQGNSTNFRLATNGATLAVFRGSEVLLDRVNSFTFNYYNDQGQELSAEAGNIPNIRRIKVNITTAPVSDEGQIALSTIITPRQFIGYANYQVQ